MAGSGPAMTICIPVALRRLDVNQWRQRSFVLHSNGGVTITYEREQRSGRWLLGQDVRPISEALMVRVLCLLFAMILSDMCSALEIRRVAACSGVVLRLRGDFRDGDYARFKSHFRKKTAVIGLDLSSDGGVLEEAVRIANLARQKKLSVYVAEECNSVCAFVFFAAAKRYLAQNSKIGVHSVSNSRYIEDLDSMRLTLELARLSAKLGAPESAIGKIVTTRPSNITYLDAGDLSALDTSVGSPFHYQRPENLSGATKEQQQSCSTNVR
jgi:hypothetical protein